MKRNSMMEVTEQKEAGKGGEINRKSVQPSAYHSAGGEQLLCTQTRTLLLLRDYTNCCTHIGMHLTL